MASFVYRIYAKYEPGPSGQSDDTTQHESARALGRNDGRGGWPARCMSRHIRTTALSIMHETVEGVEVLGLVQRDAHDALLGESSEAVRQHIEVVVALLGRHVDICWPRSTRCVLKLKMYLATALYDAPRPPGRAAAKGACGEARASPHAKAHHGDTLHQPHGGSA